MLDHQGLMPCTVYVALLWNIIHWICIWKPLFVTPLWLNLTILCNARSTYIDDWICLNDDDNNNDNDDDNNSENNNDDNNDSDYDHDNKDTNNDNDINDNNDGKY